MFFQETTTSDTQFVFDQQHVLTYVPNVDKEKKNEGHIVYIKYKGEGDRGNLPIIIIERYYIIKAVNANIIMALNSNSQHILLTRSTTVTTVESR